ncbi:MAG TPA: BON domain-containing protein [Chloroflexota bacterium]|nr:BON domain-containing protein [Chloroflexota bacterium]
MSHEEGSELDRELVAGVPEDEAMEVEVRDALAWDGRLDSSSIRVGVCAGAATLWGYVRTEDEKRLAEELASGVHGITDVANDLKVLGEAACE